MISQGCSRKFCFFNGHPQEYTIQSTLLSTRNKETLNSAQGRLWGEFMGVHGGGAKTQGWKLEEPYGIESIISGLSLSFSLPAATHLPTWSPSVPLFSFLTYFLSFFVLQVPTLAILAHNPQNSACVTNCNFTD